MRRVVILAAVAAFLTTPAWAAQVSDPQFLWAIYTPVDAQTINAVETYTSSAIEMPGQYFGVWYQCISAAGSPDIKLEFLMSYSTSATFVEPEGATDIVTNLTDETAHVEALSPPPMQYMKIKVTGNAANPADTVCTVKLAVQ